MERKLGRLDADVGTIHVNVITKLIVNFICSGLVTPKPAPADWKSGHKVARVSRPVGHGITGRETRATPSAKSARPPPPDASPLDA
jgi:hypothetical protein